MPPRSAQEALEHERRVQQALAELAVFARAYRAAEEHGAAREVRHEGWRPGARIGAGTPTGAVLARHESGWDAECKFREGEQTLFNIMSTGFGGQLGQRPYYIFGVAECVTGIVAPEVARLELISPAGQAHPADVLAGTFGVDLDLRRTPLPETGPVEDRIDALWAAMAEAREALRAYTVRIHDGEGVLLHEGPVVPYDGDQPAG